VRARRIELLRTLLSHPEDFQAEANFENSLAAAVTKDDDRRLLERCFGGLRLNTCYAHLASRPAQIQAAFGRDALRAVRPPPPELLRQLKAARCEKVENKTHERASGEDCSHMALPLAQFIKATNRFKKKPQKHSTSKLVFASHSYTPFPPRNVKACTGPAQALSNPRTIWRHTGDFGLRGR